MSLELIAISLKNGFSVIQCEGLREKDIRLKKIKRNNFKMLKEKANRFRLAFLLFLLGD